MWSDILLALAATVFIAAGVFLFTWAMVQTWGEFGPIFQRLRHRARHPWEDEERALESLQERVHHLDPELLPPSPKAESPPEETSPPAETS